MPVNLPVKKDLWNIKEIDYSQSSKFKELFQSNPALIITSDVHLGGGQTKPHLFYQFLKAIVEKHNRDITFRYNFKCLLFAGDVFDILMTDFSTLYNKYGYLMELIEEINGFDGVRVIFLLGNHEISVTGDHEKKFAGRKDKFIDKFKENLSTFNQEFKFISKANIFQYAILENKKDNNNWVLSLYNSRENLKKQHESDTTVTVGEVQLGKDNSDQKYLVCHGHQFFEMETQISGMLIWNGLLASRSEVREQINDFYNESGLRNVLKGIAKFNLSKLQKKFVNLVGQKKIEKTKVNWLSKVSQSIKKTLNFEDFADRLVLMGDSIKKPFRVYYNAIVDNSQITKFKLDGLLHTKEEEMILEKMMQSDLSLKKLKKMLGKSEKIIKFVTKKMFQDINEFTHVIYGHTHDKDSQSYGGIEIINDGAWQHVNPSWVEFYLDGTTQIISIDGDRDELHLSDK